MKLDEEDEGRETNSNDDAALVHPSHQEVMRLNVALLSDGVGGINVDVALPHS